MANNRDVTTITPAHKFSAHNKYLIRCLLSSDVKHLATCSADTTVKIWSTEGEFPLETKLEGHQRWVWDCAFSADSAYLVTGLQPLCSLVKLTFSVVRSCRPTVGIKQWENDTSILWSS